MEQAVPAFGLPNVGAMNDLLASMNELLKNNKEIIREILERSERILRAVDDDETHALIDAIKSNWKLVLGQIQNSLASLVGFFNDLPATRTKLTAYAIVLIVSVVLCAVAAVLWTYSFFRCQQKY